jgi:hypothetical protein
MGSEMEIVATDWQWPSSRMRAQDREPQGLVAAVDLSVRKRGSIDAEAFLTVRTSDEGKWHAKRVRWATERIPVLQGQCRKPI